MTSKIARGQQNYLLIASGSVRNAPYLVGWQEFKDHVRNHVKGQPSWTSVLPGKRSGEVEGWTTLKDKDDAQTVYDACCRYQGILVHVFATSKQGSYFDLVQCNCSMHFHDVAKDGHSTRKSNMDTGRINQILVGGDSTTTPQYTAATQAAYQNANYYANLPHTLTSTYSNPAAIMQYAAPPVPAYSQSSGGLPVNLSQGAVITESRGIFIHGLNYNAGHEDIVSLINGLGLLFRKIKIFRDSHGASKGCATVEFKSKRDAQSAVTRLNDGIHMGKQLTVRLDADPTIVGRVPPTLIGGAAIADGTYQYRY